MTAVRGRPGPPGGEERGPRDASRLRAELEPPEGPARTPPSEAARRVERALQRRTPRRSPRAEPEEPERQAAVTLVLRPGDAKGEEPHRPVPPDGAAGIDRSAAPLFDRPLEAGLRGVEALFIVRAERDGDPWSGQVGLPGGHAEAVDDELVDAALRELDEETGLSLDRSAVLGRLDRIRPRSRRLPSIAVTPFVAWHRGGEPPRPGPEVAGHFWMPLYALEAPRYRAVLTFRRRGAYRAFPGVGHEQGVVWGLTFAILRRFLGVLPRTGQG